MSDFIVSDLRSEPWFLLQYAVFKVPSSLLPDFWKPVKCIKDFIVCQPLFRLTFDRVFCQMETERFELLTPCLQGRCSPNWATPPYLIGGHLLSHTVSSIVPSAVWVLTIVFGMGTGVTPRRIATKIFCYLYLLDNQTVKQPLLFFLERRWSSRTFRYGYLVTTSPQLSILPSAAPSLRLGHWLRALPTPMVWRAVCTRPGNVFTAAFWSAITSDSSFM